MQGKSWSLYDMQADPSQTKDIANDKPDVLKLLSEAYQTWWADVKKDADKPRDVPEIGHAEENPIELTTPNGKLSGSMDFGRLPPNNSWIHNWTSTSDTVTWDVNVVAAGDYEIELQYICPQDSAGAKIEVSAGSQHLPATVTGTPIIAFPSPDRVERKEAYEMQWSRLKPGKLHLEEGRTTIEVKALEKPGAEVMQLKAIWLKR
jgi:hypothetical protein